MENKQQPPIESGYVWQEISIEEALPEMGAFIAVKSPEDFWDCYRSPDDDADDEGFRAWLQSIRVHAFLRRVPIDQIRYSEEQMKEAMIHAGMLGRKFACLTMPGAIVLTEIIKYLKALKAKAKQP